MGAPPKDVNWSDYQTEDSTEAITTNDPTNEEVGMKDTKGD